ncbi:MAG: hypothetical protein CGU28_01395 [Candidatus Dactylopiibacterium carminicum]|uniref:Uncharacterized protein n=1 Tax=Candidatus Dactylopiibacterium carminicum TaxID=857335 RepID=A0A272EXF4_9RHOO|nr:hypothetical protein [Candidatus Dactylopiibacterium carminicum]KAF7599486.1 hypothetical protein BGI27_07365 [Candidatus Dactylopiibacterium carminicum]PAS94320.1 MAG: hypothetical protein CGU29_04745 [Candidatus Dactylopiibacterium carminicum]PAS98514.1 MAG: hypothetical protein CGU28_01395 [Candidatus Dactylopiibacterium carminicum]PAS99495.1 MAG: hypothetical protein BSR46_07400 [Candidatus Dactylopiibacterium carminicum]
MRIEDSISYAAGRLSQPLAVGNTTTSFSSALAGAQQQQAAAAVGKSAGSADSGELKSETPNRLESLLEELREYQRKSPMERLREQLLADMNLTEESLAALPPEQREAIEAAITAEIKARLLAQDKQTPDTTNISADARLQQLLAAG